MELELDRTQRSGYEAVLDTTVCREETLESIVPDACPDILRICDTEGVVCLRDKVLQDGRVELSGSVRRCSTSRTVKRGYAGWRWNCPFPVLWSTRR